MSDDPKTHAAEAIIDGEQPDWQTLDVDDALSAGLKRIEEVAAAFRQAAKPTQADARSILFQWKHLEVVEQIGEGAFGTVYRAFDPMLRRDVALKMARQVDGASLYSGVIASEARQMARLRHPNILAVHGTGEDDGNVGIWSDLLHGVTLQDQIDTHGPLPASLLIDLAEPLSDALCLLHSKALTHGDIKPANIMIEGKASPVLMDFGAARNAVTRSSATLGSPLVMAPEHFTGEVITQASDVYAFGVVLFYSLTGEFPLQARTLEELAGKHSRGYKLDMQNVPWNWRKLLRHMLMQEPLRRPTASDVRDRLAHIKTTKPRLLRRSLIAGIIAALSVGIVAATLSYQTAKRSQERVETIKDVVVEALESSLPSQKSGPTTVNAVYLKLADLIEERLAADPDALADMRILTGKGLAEFGQHDQGINIAEQGLSLMQRVKADNPLDLSEAWLVLATLRRNAGDLVGSELALSEASAQIALRTDDDAAATSLVARNKLVSLLGEQGRWLEELQAQRELLVDRIALHGIDSVRVAVDHHNLADYLVAFGEIDEALQNESRAAALLRMDGDDKSVRMGIILIGVAYAHIEAGNIQPAQTALNEARVLITTVLPPTHAYFNSIDRLQAGVLTHNGETKQAEALFAELLDRESLSPNQHIQVKHNLADLLLRQERWPEAITYFEDLRETVTGRYAPLKPYFAAALAYAEFMGGDTQPPSLATIQTIETSLATMKEAGYEKIAAYRDLAKFRADLQAAK